MPTHSSRRKEDRCLVVKLWNRFHPYQEIIGYAVMLGSIIVTLTLFYSKVDAYDARITDTNLRVDLIQKEQRESLILLQRIDQRVSDMYERSN